MVDTRSWSSCASHGHNGANNNIEKASEEEPMTVESLIESELRKLTEEVCKTAAVDKEECVKKASDKVGGDSDHHDEGFCDKSSTVTGPSSPDSANLGLEDE